MSYPHLRISGTPLERGRQYGEGARDRVHRSIEGYARAFDAYAGWSWIRAREEASRFLEPVVAYGPAYAEEMQGIADGAGVELGDVLTLNARTEIVASAWLPAGGPPRSDGCSSVAITADATADGHTLVAQNWDWMVHALDTVVVLEVEREDGPSYVTVVEAGLLAKVGLNAAGLGVATNFLLTRADVGATGVPYHVTLRALLDAGTMPQALDALQRATRASSANYVLGHADGLAVDIEAAPGDHAQLELVFPEDGAVAHTNHFYAPPMAEADMTRLVAPSSPFRLHRLRTLLAARPVRVEDVQAALRDHAGFPSGVCCHADTREAEHERDVTAVSIVMDVDARRIALADGNPCVAPYRDLDYGALLGDGDAPGRMQWAPGARA